MPLAFTQEDFLVFSEVNKFVVKVPLASDSFYVGKERKEMLMF